MWQSTIDGLPRPVDRPRARYNPKTGKSYVSNSEWYTEYKAEMIQKFNGYKDDPQLVDVLRNQKYGIAVKVIYKFPRGDHKRPMVRSKPDLDNLVKATVDALFESDCAVKPVTHKDGNVTYERIGDSNITRMDVIKIYVDDDETGQDITMIKMLEEEFPEPERGDAVWQVSLPGIPQPADRPRARYNPKTGKSYVSTSKRYMEYKDSQIAEFDVHKDDPLLQDILRNQRYGIGLKVIYKFPRNGNTRPLVRSRPDLDNLVKATVDALFESECALKPVAHRDGSVSYERIDDSNITRMDILKVYVDDADVGQEIILTKMLEE